MFDNGYKRQTLTMTTKQPEVSDIREPAFGLFLDATTRNGL